LNNRKTVLVYSTTGLSLPHLSIEKEVLDKNLDGYDRRLLLKCNSELRSCYLNPTHNIIACALCKQRTKKYIELAFDFDKIFTLDRQYDQIKVDFDSIKDISDLMEYSYKGIEIGRGIGSSMISIKRNYKLNLEDYKSYILDLLTQSKALVDQIDKIVKAENITDVFLFNGRFFEHYPILAYCRLHGINFHTHEKGANFSKYQLIKNNTVHSIDYRKEQIEAVWNNFGPEKEKVANAWYRNKKDGKITSEINFTTDQNDSELPTGFDKSKHNITIFNSSEDEFKSIKEWQHTLYKDQCEIIIKVCRELENDKSLRFYLRFHPNLKGLAYGDLARLEDARLSNLVILRPESTVSSYQLMLSSDKVLSFGSRTSIESAYWGIPSVIYGRSFYESLESLYNPSSFVELVGLLRDKNLNNKNGVDLLKAALFLQERGHKLDYADIKSKNEVFYKGKSISDSFAKAIPYLKLSMSELKLWNNYFKILKGRSLNIKDIKVL